MQIVRASYRGAYIETHPYGDGWLTVLDWEKAPQPKTPEAIQRRDNLAVELADLRNKVNEHIEFSKKRKGI